MLAHNSYMASPTAQGKRAWCLTSILRTQPAWRPVDDGPWHPVKQLASAGLVTVAVLTVAQPAHALVDASRASLRPPEAVQSQACDVASSVSFLNPVAELSGGLFGSGNDVPDERDPITPFTLYGTSFKKYLIEQLQGEKIVSRKKGFTVDACVGAVEVTQETPQFQGLPTGDKALYSKNRVCRKSEGQDLKETCRSACEAACGDAVDAYGQQLSQKSGFALLASDKARLVRSCSRNCAYECSKPGKAFDFVIPYRR